MTDTKHAVPSSYWTTRMSTAASAPLSGFHFVGQWLVFVGQVLWLLPLTVRKYRRATLQQMNSLAWGRGSLIVDGGVITVLLLLGIAVGGSLAIEALATLNQLGFGALSGLMSGVGCVREIGPLVGGIAFAAQSGCRMTAEIGAMRIGEEIDAVEAMGLRPISFVVGTRLIGGMLCVIPGYMMTLIATFVVMDLVVVQFNGQPLGTFNHYFVEFLTPRDLLYSVIKVAVFCAVVTLIHCFYGYFASGGPVGVGRASGQAVRASLVMVMVMDLAMTVMLWGLQPVFVFKG
ncbi:ABC transporter permease [Mycobacterium sp. CBMA293]|uniref:MlaE family ABC transporter permease n=2 Tax=unclassified Mycolicibacterium TaxID=2636767 RepID=UPI0012DEA8A4|nr:ABC transporter permease [Mycolicibacterium sp. CBMA 360]MUL57239.1 ABC transporter permease [Mycolicibacterium sp. CBMA 335]MUL70279.1 ABC transporter permease [Mycolicibacterium sp. CBMA 311]MUL92327.1 ABC transporter permease [Mycolicibacterium sp. CBMA 230]MUM06748.1 ABC transporter permease [Mycolicibacterium sp. CBMA 213]MUM12590.1 ABC transporter permease [Mycolicibacterium sp. CBMA 293]MUM35347.1 ABC transporter permease [Mycolicibacterium sp. CBMA 361]